MRRTLEANLLFSDAIAAEFEDDHLIRVARSVLFGVWPRRVVLPDDLNLASRRVKRDTGTRSEDRRVIVAQWVVCDFALEDLPTETAHTRRIKGGYDAKLPAAPEIPLAGVGTEPDSNMCEPLRSSPRDRPLLLTKSHIDGGLDELQRHSPYLLCVDFGDRDRLS